MISRIRETRTTMRTTSGEPVPLTVPLLNSCMRTYEIPPHMTANEKTTAMAEIMAAWTRVMMRREATRC